MAQLRAWLAGLSLSCVSLGAAAQQKQEEATVLEGYVRALSKKGLAKREERIEVLEDAVEQAQRALIAGDKGEARARLLEIVEGPRFVDFRGADTFHTAELMLASALTEAHALLSAQRIIDRMLARGPELSAFGPAYRRAVDIALARGDLTESVEHLRAISAGALGEDQKNELAYLSGRAAYERGALAVAQRELSAVTERSRFHASAQYLLGAIAAKERRFDEAERRFCTITQAEKDDAFSFYVDARFFPVRDLAHLALGRVAHETGRANDAFYYYFQVPNDSSRLAEAMFEAAWASYEGGDHDAALDSLDQLEARFLRSPFTAEAAVLRGYVHLSRCEFGLAEKHLTAFEKQFGPVLRELERTANSGARKRDLYRDLIARERSRARLERDAEQGKPSPDSLLLALIQADPDFYRLNAQLEALDAELALSGAAPRGLSAMASSLSAGKTPAPRLDEQAEPDPVAALEAELAAARAGLVSLEHELSALGGAGADRRELSSLWATQKALDRRISEIEEKLRAEVRAREASARAPSRDEDLIALMTADQRYVEAVRIRAQKVRAELQEARDAAGARTLAKVRERLSAELRRARIGRIDAVMGGKRQVELQIESLAAGRFPPELVDVVRMQSLLRDDEEYWPFEGEDWPDEFLELYPEEDPEDEP